MPETTVSANRLELLQIADAVARDKAIDKSVVIILAASVIAGVIEPAWEYWIDGATFEWAFGALRLTHFATFLGAGLVTHALVLPLILRQARKIRITRLPSP